MSNKGYQIGREAGGGLRVDVRCPKCGAEMTELEFNRKNLGGVFLWESFRKCPECGVKVKW